MEYTIIVASGISSLENVVDEFCRLGWEPQGGIVFDPTTKLYCQPAVRELKDGAKEN